MTAEVLRGRHGDGCRAGESRLEEPVSAQPEHTPIPSYRPHPTPRPNSCPQLRTDRRAAQWVPALEGEWAAAPAESVRR